MNLLYIALPKRPDAPVRNIRLSLPVIVTIVTNLYARSSSHQGVATVNGRLAKLPTTAIYVDPNHPNQHHSQYSYDLAAQSP
jgi:hypothetical protein